MITFSLQRQPISWLPSRICKGHSYNPRHTEKTDVMREIASLGLPRILGYCAIEFEFVFKIPKSSAKRKHKKMICGEIYPTSKDCTNCQKFMEDCLKNICINDDRYVVHISSSKRFDYSPQIIVRIYSLEEYKEKMRA
jgi:Holliday junction resolvase RusA-like endonuclease